MLFLLIGLVSSSVLPYFYHTSTEVLQSIKDLKCDSLEVIQEDSIHAVKIGSESECKTFLIFGEHPRELISVELALYFIESICKDPVDTQLIIVVNANPAARERVENGEFCLRTNNNGVDLNRNWGAFWQQTSCEPGSEICSGPEPYSEIETQLMQALLDSFSPMLFLSIHSGTDAMLYPYAYTYDKIDSNVEQKYIKMLKEARKEAKLYGDVGQASSVLKYLASGTCLDYAFSENIEFSYAFEIFGKEKKDNFLQIVLAADDDDECFKFFNPGTNDEYLDLLERWSNAIRSSVKLSCS